MWGNNVYENNSLQQNVDSKYYSYELKFALFNTSLVKLHQIFSIQWNIFCTYTIDDSCLYYDVHDLILFENDLISDL